MTPPRQPRLLTDLSCNSASASLSPNGANLAVSNVSRGFDVYKIQSAEPIASFDNDDNPRTSSDEPACPVPVKFIHGGHAIVGGSMNGKVGLWDLGHGKMHTLPLNSKRQRACCRYCGH